MHTFNLDPFFWNPDLYIKWSTWHLHLVIQEPSQRHCTQDLPDLPLVLLIFMAFPFPQAKTLAASSVSFFPLYIYSSVNFMRSTYKINLESNDFLPFPLLVTRSHILPTRQLHQLTIVSPCFHPYHSPSTHIYTRSLLNVAARGMF